MSLRREFTLLLLVWFGAGFALLFIGIAARQPWAVAGLLALFLFCGLWMINLSRRARCAACGQRLLQRPVSVVGREIAVGALWYPRNCPRCGRPT
jgi:hypothetical protein